MGKEKHLIKNNVFQAVTGRKNPRLVYLLFCFSKQHVGKNGCYKHYITFINYTKLNPYQTAALGPYLQTS